VKGEGIHLTTANKLQTKLILWLILDTGNKIIQQHYTDNLHSAPAIQSKTLKYGHAELEKENEKEHEEVEWTVTPKINKCQAYKNHYYTTYVYFLKHIFM